MRYQREFLKQLDRMEQQSYALYLLKDTCENYDDGVKHATSLKWYLKRHLEMDKVAYCRRGETIYIFRKDI